VTGLDRRLERWIVEHRWHPLDDVFVWLTRIGSNGAVWLAIGLALALAWRRPRPFVLVLLAVAAADLIATLLKLAVGESRPHEPHPLVAIPHSSAFPSGHAATAFAGATVLSALVPRFAPAFYVLAAAIAYSRLYVGVHWPLDVLAGAAIGVVTALLLLAADRRRSWRWPRRG
jgi:undecaprenyl-diphosphatase